MITQISVNALSFLPLVVDDTPIDVLVTSVRSIGVTRPIIVRPLPEGMYEIIDGRKRAKAAIKVGLVEIPALIMTEQEARYIVENFHGPETPYHGEGIDVGNMAQRLIEQGIQFPEIATRMNRDEIMIRYWHTMRNA